MSRTRRLIRKLKGIKKFLTDIFWGRLIANTINELGRDDAGDMAAVIAYYALLSMFPLLLGVIALLGIFLPSELVQKEILAFFAQNLPIPTGILKENISLIIELRSTLGILSLLGLFWSGSTIFDALGRVIKRAWDIEQPRPFLVRKTIDLTLALSTSIMFLLSMGLTTLFLILPELEFPLGQTVTFLLSKVLPFLFMLSTFLLIYKYLPNTRVKWREALPGAILAAILFEIIRILFSLYLTHFARYELVYGSVASIIVLLAWIYFSAFILILGAEFSSEYIKLKHHRFFLEQ